MTTNPNPRALPPGVTLERMGTCHHSESEVTRVLLDGRHVGLLEHCYATGTDFMGNRSNWTRCWIPQGAGVRPLQHRTRREALAALLAAHDREAGVLAALGRALPEVTR